MSTASPTSAFNQVAAQRGFLLRWAPLLAVAVLLLAAILAYRPGLHGPFLFDDHVSLVLLAEDERSIGQWVERLSNAPSNVRKRVIANLSFMTNQALAGAWTSHPPFPFKLGNLLIHLLTAAAVLALARQLALLAGADQSRALWVGVLAAGFFALHPLQVSTTLYVVQRMAQLSALFSLLAVLAYVQWRTSLGRSGDVRNVLHLALVPLFALLAFLSKENGALVPLYLLVVELCFFGFPAGAFRPVKKEMQVPAPAASGSVPPTEVKARFEMGFGLMVAGPLLAALAMLPFLWSRLSDGYLIRDFTMAERVMTQVHALGHYLGLILWPRVGAMGLYRDDFPLTRSLDLPTLLLGAAFVAVAILALVFRRRAPVLAFAALWFFACHAMESSFLALELVFEHRNYLALVGPAVALAWALVHLSKPRWLGPAVATVLLSLLAVQTSVRADAWSSHERWLQHEVSNRPESLRAGTDLVLFLANRGRSEEALHVLERMEPRHPESGHPLLVTTVLRCFGITPARVGEPAGAALRHRTLSKDGFHLFGMVMERMESDRCEGLAWSDVASLAGAAADNPTVTRYAESAAAWRRYEARAHMRMQDWARAQASLEAVLALRDDDPRDWLALAEVRLRQDDIEGFLQARSGLLALWPRPEGDIAMRLRELDSAMARAARNSGDE